MKVKFFFFTLILLSHFAFTQEKTRIGCLKGMSSLVFCHFMDSEDYEFFTYDSARDLVSAMKGGEIDATNLPAFMAEKIEEKSQGRLVIPLITSTTDVKLVSNDENIHTFSDLLGKEVYLVKDSYEEYFFKELLKLSNVPIKTGESGVEVAYMASNAEITSSLIVGKITCAVLSEPYVSASLVNSYKNHISLDFQDEYVKIYGNRRIVPKSVLLVLTQYRDTRRKDYNKLLENIRNSISTINSHPNFTAKKAKKYKLDLPMTASVRSIKNSHFLYKENDENIHELLYNE